MPGLNLMFGTKVSAGSGFSSSSGPATAGEAGFGQGYTSAGSPSGTNALTPNDPFGVAFWGGIVSLGVLLLIRHSLPA